MADDLDSLFDIDNDFRFDAGTDKFVLSGGNNGTNPTDANGNPPPVLVWGNRKRHQDGKPAVMEL